MTMGERTVGDLPGPFRSALLEASLYSRRPGPRWPRGRPKRPPVRHAARRQAGRCVFGRATQRTAPRDRRPAATGGAPSTGAQKHSRRDSCRGPARRPTKRRGSILPRSRGRRCAPARRRSGPRSPGASCAAPSALRSPAARSSLGRYRCPCRARWRLPRASSGRSRSGSAPPGRRRTWPPDKDARKSGTSTGGGDRHVQRLEIAELVPGLAGGSKGANLVPPVNAHAVILCYGRRAPSCLLPLAKQELLTIASVPRRPIHDDGGANRRGPVRLLPVRPSRSFPLFSPPAAPMVPGRTEGMEDDGSGRRCGALSGGSGRPRRSSRQAAASGRERRPEPGSRAWTKPWSWFTE